MSKQSLSPQHETTTATTTEKVGHCHPPIHSRFKPGQSGNPAGRPKRRKTFLMDLTEVLDALEPGPGKKTNQRRIAENLVEGARKRESLAIKVVVPLAVSLDNDKGEGDGELTELQRQLVDDFDRREASAEGVATPSHDSDDQTGGTHE